MASLDQFVDDRLLHGRAHFNREEALAAVDLNPDGLTAAITRLVKKQRLANPRHGFYLILRPEDQMTGAPDPVRWIDPLMKHQGLDCGWPGYGEARMRRRVCSKDSESCCSGDRCLGGERAGHYPTTAKPREERFDGVAEPACAGGRHAFGRQYALHSAEHEYLTGRSGYGTGNRIFR